MSEFQCTKCGKGLRRNGMWAVHHQATRGAGDDYIAVNADPREQKALGFLCDWECLAAWSAGFVRARSARNELPTELDN